MAWRKGKLAPSARCVAQCNSFMEASPSSTSRGRACASQEEPTTPLSVRNLKNEVKEVAKEVADMASDAAAPVIEAIKKRVRLRWASSRCWLLAGAPPLTAAELGYGLLASWPRIDPNTPLYIVVGVHGKGDLGAVDLLPAPCLGLQGPGRPPKTPVAAKTPAAEPLAPRRTRAAARTPAG